jgi:predicted acetyltransferase
MSQKEAFEFRKLTESDIEEFDALLRYAFQVTSNEMKRTGWSDKAIKLSKKPVFDSSYVLGWFFEGHLASQVVVYPMRVNVHGKIVNMGGITGVATYPEYTGYGLIHKLLKNALEHMREEKQYISFLYPYSIPFYRKQGWEVVSDKMTFSIKDTQLPYRKNVGGMMRRVNAEDNEDIHKVYQYFALQHHGALLREDLEWQEYWRWESDDDVMGAVYYDAKDKPLGFVIYYIENDVFRIKEMVYLNMEAKNGIWNYITAHFSMIDEVRGDNYSGEAISFQFEDSEISETIEPYIMARIVDVEQFMKKYPFHFTDNNIHFYFQVSDPVARWNNGTFHVGIKEGRQYCEKVAEYDNVHLVRTDICSLTTMLMGYKRPNYLYTNERLHMNYNLLRHLEAVVPSEKPYFSDYF